MKKKIEANSTCRVRYALHLYKTAFVLSSYIIKIEGQDKKFVDKFHKMRLS